MKIQFATKQMTVPERVYSHAEHRINELDPFFRGTPEAAVVFGAEDGKAVVELTIFAGSTIFRVVEKTSDMMVSSVRRQLRENYARLPKEVNADAFEKETDEVTFIPELNRFDAPAYQVVRLKNFSFGNMTVQEAILQMNLIGHAFFAFRNEEKDGAFSVVGAACWWTSTDARPAGRWLLCTCLTVSRKLNNREALPTNIGSALLMRLTWGGKGHLL